MRPGPAPHLVLVIGGVRSGKSRFAERLASRESGPVLYVATASARDVEMQSRIGTHQARRPAHWTTVECFTKVAGTVAAAGPGFGAVLLEDLGNLLSNVLFETATENGVDVPPLEQCQERVRAEVEALLVAHHVGSARWILVSNEVGQGLVPLHPLGRIYVDLLGWLNQEVARHADRVYLVTAGYAVDVRALGEPVE